MKPFEPTPAVLLVVLRELLKQLEAAELDAYVFYQQEARRAPIEALTSFDPEVAVNRLHRQAELAFHQRAALAIVLRWLCPGAAEPGPELHAPPNGAAVLELLTVEEQTGLAALQAELLERLQAAGRQAMHPMSDGLCTADDARMWSSHADHIGQMRDAVSKLIRLATPTQPAAGCRI